MNEICGDMEEELQAVQKIFFHSAHGTCLNCLEAWLPWCGNAQMWSCLASKSSTKIWGSIAFWHPDPIDSIRKLLLHRAQGESAMISAASLMKPKYLSLSSIFPYIIKYLAVAKYSGWIPQVQRVFWAAEVPAVQVGSTCKAALGRDPCASPPDDAKHWGLLAFPPPVSLWSSQSSHPPKPAPFTAAKGQCGQMSHRSTLSCRPMFGCSLTQPSMLPWRVRVSWTCCEARCIISHWACYRPLLCSA